MASRRLRLVSLVAASAAALATTAMRPRAGATGVIRGQVVATDPGPPPARPRVSDLSGARHDPIDRRRSVVFLEKYPVYAFEELRAGRAKLDQRGQQFVPRVLAITVGTIVDIPNNDTVFHNAFSLAPIRPFDVGRYPPGRTRSVKFDRPGIIPVFCDIHSHMSAYILVFSHPFFAVTDDTGRYTIPGVPAGTYSVAIWSELGRAAARSVTLGEGDVIDATFQVGRTP
jgi:plastocyanin